jgi:hypothetical protein
MNNSPSVHAFEKTSSICMRCGRTLYLYRHFNLSTCTQYIFALMDECEDQLPPWMIAELVMIQAECFSLSGGKGCSFNPLPPGQFLQLEDD